MTRTNSNVVDSGYTGAPFGDETYTILGASVQVVKRNTLQVELSNPHASEWIQNLVRLRNSESNRSSGVEHHYWLQGKDGTRGAEMQMGWDIRQNITTA